MQSTAPLTASGSAVGAAPPAVTLEVPAALHRTSLLRRLCRPLVYGGIRPALQAARQRVFRPLYFRLGKRDLVRNAELHDLDARYALMHQLHAGMHRQALELIEPQAATVLEVACGTAINAPAFTARGLEYWGLDISETALCGAMAKRPLSRFLNLSVHDLRVLADGAFDVVYCSSMLEHIGGWADAIREMVRIARRQLLLCFFEGLSANDQHAVAFHPYSPQQVSGAARDPWGRKIVLQHDPPGWYWNRYALRPIEELLRSLDVSYTHHNAANSPMLKRESVIDVRTRADHGTGPE